MKYAVPDQKQREIISRNGIDPDSVAVFMAGKDFIRLLVYKTRDTITISMGDKQWK